MKHVVMFSGGAGSWAAAKCVAQRYGSSADIVLLFADTLIEDNDLYRFLVEGAADVFGISHVSEIVDLTIRARNLPPIESGQERKEALASFRADAQKALPELVWISEGRTPWEVFFDVRYMGNTRVDPCSKVLKRDLIKRWLQDNCDPAETTCYVGIDWTEEHRYTKLRARHAENGWRYEAPLCEEPYLPKSRINLWLQEGGIALPRLYKQGFPHNNCGGFCVKAGQAHFALLLKTAPERYRFHEEQEQRFREFIGKDVSIMRDRRGGLVKPLPMAVLRKRIEAKQEIDKFEWGGCGCFADEEEEVKS